MILLYAYIEKYKNYVNQEVSFDSSYSVSFEDGFLSLAYNGKSETRRFCHSGKPDNLHIIVGKTGSGKTNLLQLIGAKKSTRAERRWSGEDDAYFLLYSISKTEFFLEICNVDIKQFPIESGQEDPTMPESFRDNAKRMDSVRSVRFKTAQKISDGERISDFTVIREYGERPMVSERVRDHSAIINCYDTHAFIVPPYPDEKETCDDFQQDWIGRMVIPYQRTSLWKLCDFIREYIADVESGAVKRNVSLVLSTHNFADKYPVKLPYAIEEEYWTFSSLERDQQIASLDDEAKARLKKMKPHVKKLKSLQKKDLFIHDLWTDYALYLRKWVLKIQNYNAEETIPEDSLDVTGEHDVFQEFIDYYTDKEYKEDIDPSDLPDGMHMSIIKRCKWLAEYIDRADNGDPHGVLWQIFDDIKDITDFLKKLDNKYFTIDTCTIPVVDMVLPKYNELFMDLFERMEQYIPDDAGIFTECLLPYRFTHLSTGEFQYAKVLGGFDQNLQMFLHGNAKLDKIILMDEPETYMHPELARQFIKRLYDIVNNHENNGTVQIIIGTHSPFFVSDLLPEDITRLTIDSETGNAIVLRESEKEYFGANLYTILSDSFFLDYTIGEYSRNFLQEQLQKIKTLEQKEALSEEDEQYIEQLNSFVTHIGEPLIKRFFEASLRHLRR